jgi:group I intron endonuclease
MAFIYILTNIQNGHQYIGKTSRSFDVRLSQHISDAERHITNSYIHRAIRKYGIENFHIECIEVANHLTNLWEKHLIRRWGSRFPSGYNLTDGGDGFSPGNVPHNNGKHLSEETRRKVSASKKGQRCSISTEYTSGTGNPHSKKMLLILPNGTEEVFDSKRLGCLKYGLNTGQMSLVCRGIEKSHKGFKARYI